VALWHVPLIFIEGEDLPPIFLFATVAVTFFYTWLFVHTGGSVFITILAHAAEGLIGRKLIGDDGWSGSDETNWVWLYTTAWCALAIVLLAFDWQFWRARTPSTSGAVHGQPPETHFTRTTQAVPGGSPSWPANRRQRVGSTASIIVTIEMSKRRWTQAANQ